MNAIVYKVTCLTNLHVGNGEANFDIIDNTVEKDPVTGLPTINSSGVKGALRQFFKENKVDDTIITNIFGTDVKSSAENNEKSMPGNVKFYQADLLARPLRASQGSAAYYMTTSLDALDLYNTKMQVFGSSTVSVNITGIDKNVNYKTTDHIGVEGNIKLDTITDVKKELSSIIGENDIVILQNSILKEMPLPVLARNQLDNGISNNLWYEEVVPHKSIFTFAVSSADSKVLADFDKKMGIQQYVQFGGNASIGYGLCKVEKIFPIPKKDGEQA